jgi:hypothetical protein
LLCLRLPAVNEDVSNCGVYLKIAITSVILTYRDAAITGIEGHQRLPTLETYTEARKTVGSNRSICQPEVRNNIALKTRFYVTRTIMK